MRIVKRVSVIVLLGLLLIGMTAVSASALYTTGPTAGSQDITMYGNPQNAGKMTPAGNDTTAIATVPVSAPAAYGSTYPAAGMGTGMSGGYSPISGYPAAYGAAPIGAAGYGAIPLPAAVPEVPIVSGGFTRTYTSNVAGGTFVPPQAEMTQSFYSHPGISPYGVYPGGGIASGFGIGFTPMGYGPYGGTVPLI